LAFSSKTKTTSIDLRQAWASWVSKTNRGNDEAMEYDPHKAVEYIIKESGNYAAAKANRTYIENYLRSAKSAFMLESSATSIAAKEMEAYANEDYIALLHGLKEAIEEEESLKWKLIAAQARIEIWRSQEATNRTIDRATQ
jgi:hypothetical protein